VMRTAAVNLWLHSGDATLAASFFTAGTSAPVTTGNQTTAPDGTLTAASAAFPAVPTGETCVLYQSFVVPAAGTYTFSVYLKGAVGGEQIYLGANSSTVQYVDSPRITLTTAWQRYSITVSPLSGPDTVFFDVGADMRGGTATAIPAETVYVWGFQVEQGASASPYIPTTTAPNGAPRWDYDPVTHALRGLLIEEARTNLWLQSADVSNAATIKEGSGAAAPVVTANQVTAPDGTLSGDQVAYPAVSGGSAYSLLYQPVPVNATVYTFSIYLRSAVGGEQLYLGVLGSSAARTLVTLTTQWQRFSVTSPTMVAGTAYFDVGVDLRDAGSQTAKPAQTIYAWGGQVEQGSFATSYIPTVGTSVTRAQDSCTIPPANMSPWFASPGGSWMAEFIGFNPPSSLSPRVVSYPLAGNIAPLMAFPSGWMGQYDGAAGMFTANAMTPGAVAKGASAWTPGSATVCLNSGAVASSATLTAGYAALATAGVRLMADETAGDGMSGTIRRVRYWPRALSNSELQAVTT
jgi:hypothetical protein